ncbi:hypothetical protein [Demequina sp. SO4-18]|uniref:hypothetical protein n=1 Tax=Demequina sp. SO4-18 TaxID=3401026 RepID=UPI003B5BA42A
MTDATPEPTDGDDLFDDLITTGTVRRKTEHIYFDQAAIEEMASIAAEVDDLPDGPETINQTSRLKDIEKRWNAAQERYEESKVTFTLIPVDRDTTREIWTELPNPPAPPNPAKDRWPIGQNAPDRERIQKQRDLAEATFQERAKEWRKDVDAQESKRVVRFLAASIEKVVAAKGERPGMTEEQLDAIRSAPYGVERINKLWKAFEDVQQSKGEISRPFSLGDSGSATDSL